MCTQASNQESVLLGRAELGKLRPWGLYYSWRLARQRKQGAHTHTQVLPLRVHIIVDWLREVHEDKNSLTLLAMAVLAARGEGFKRHDGQPKGLSQRNRHPLSLCHQIRLLGAFNRCHCQGLAQPCVEPIGLLAACSCVGYPLRWGRAWAGLATELRAKHAWCSSGG